MVAKVNYGKNILGILNYNENKVAEGVARCIHENLFGRDVEKLTFSAKRKGLENFFNRNQRATSKAVHISLNFHASEKLQRDKLIDIASVYMEKIGFSQQPYLVYEHLDAAHPHIHIVSTNIQKDGKRILLYNIGKEKSEKARKQIEKDFGLVRASGRKHNDHEVLHPVNIRKIEYGKAETKRSISNIVRHVVSKYRYTSLPELNAVLKQFNVVADPGSGRSQMQVNKGLLYRITDERGNNLGVPIKASLIYGKPTRKFLEKQFKLNKVLREPYKSHVKDAVQRALGNKSSITKTAFVKSLSRENIEVLFRQNDEGRIYGITFVDNQNKVVFNGSDLGKAYSAKGITGRLVKFHSLAPRSEWLAYSHGNNLNSQAEINRDVMKVADDLMHAEQTDFASPDAAMRRKRKRTNKRKGRSL